MESEPENGIGTEAKMGVVLLLSGAVVLVSFLLLLWSRRCRWSLKGKHVLITGGSSGIGKALAVEALAGGALAVTILARNKSRLASAKAELEDLIPEHSKGSQKVNVIAADISDVEVKDILSKSLGPLGQVDVLVNCAGITHTATFQDTHPNKFQELFTVNVMGAVHVTQAVLPAMLKRKAGRIVFISSQAGQLALYGYTAYASSKFALRGLAETLQMEVRPFGVKVSISFPPDTDTPQLEEELTQRMPVVKELTSYGNVFKPEQIARGVWEGVVSGAFQITHGFDGFLLGVLCAGTSPVTSLCDTLLQSLLAGVFRLVSVGYQKLFERIVKKGVEADQK